MFYIFLSLVFLLVQYYNNIFTHISSLFYTIQIIILSYQIVSCVCEQGFLSQWPESDDCIKPWNDLRPNADEVTGRDGRRHDEYKVPEHYSGDYYRKPSQGVPTHMHTHTCIWTYTHLTGMYSVCCCKIFGEAPDLSVPLPPAPSSRSTPRRNKAICLSSGKRKPRLYPPALCLADNDSESLLSSL